MISIDRLGRVPARLAGELVELGPGTGAAVELLLTWIEWVEVRGFEDLIERIGLPRMAVMVAGSEELGRHVLA